MLVISPDLSVAQLDLPGHLLSPAGIAWMISITGSSPDSTTDHLEFEAAVIDPTQGTPTPCSA